MEHEQAIEMKLAYQEESCPACRGHRGGTEETAIVGPCLVHMMSSK